MNESELIIRKLSLEITSSLKQSKLFKALEDETKSKMYADFAYRLLNILVEYHEPRSIEPDRSQVFRTIAILAASLKLYTESIEYADIGLQGSPSDSVRYDLNKIRLKSNNLLKAMKI